MTVLMLQHLLEELVGVKVITKLGMPDVQKNVDMESQQYLTIKEP